jgi:hypothetical protein
MRRSWLIAAIAVLSIVIAGCGGGASHSPGVSSHPATATRPPFVCHHKQPAQLSECVQQELEYDGVKPATPPLTGTFGARRGQCVDISRWEPHPRFQQLRAEGIVCVIVQGADNTSESNPFFDEQVQHAHEAGMSVGVYVYVEGGSSTAQADALGRAASGERSRILDGAWIDTEQPDAYAHACGIAERLRHTWHYTIVGDYGSVGTVPAWMNTCGMLDWAAMWGGGAARPAPGFTFAELKFRQWCGTCVLGGNDGQIDRDEDLGLLSLAVAPRPKPTARQLHAALAAAVRRRALERSFLEHHHCRQPPWHIAVNRAGKPDGHWQHACHVELQHGRSTNRHIAQLRKEGAR